jgi:hypothetical protein
MRRFHWAELAWIEFCVKRRRSAKFCAAQMRNRHPATVQKKAEAMGLRFHGYIGGKRKGAGAKKGHRPPRTAFNSTTGRVAQRLRYA